VTCFWIIRSAAHAWLDQALVGRAPGVRLNRAGSDQARNIGRALAFAPVAAVYSSPLERALETVQPFASSRHLPVKTDDGLHEVDFGEWTGATYDELADDPQWHVWKSGKPWATTLGGETLEEVQERIIDCMERLSERHPGEHVIIVSHGEVIRCALSWHLGGGLEHRTNIEFGPGAVALLELWPGAAHLLAMRQNHALSSELLGIASRRASRPRRKLGAGLEVAAR
jgi:probable phosphoglycerate mutase